MTDRHTVIGAGQPDGLAELFHRLCADVGRQGVIGFSDPTQAKLLTEQERHLRRLLQPLGPSGSVIAVSLGLLFHQHEVMAIPGEWAATKAEAPEWGDYASAFTAVNGQLNRIAQELARRGKGVYEPATISGVASAFGHVKEYFAHCVSHRVYAEAAGIGWRGRHGLIVTPQAGPALRLATVFVPGKSAVTPTSPGDCGDCRACLEVCPLLSTARDYREACRRHKTALGLEPDV
jgi:epoxyqueuosine reductase QueG